MKFVIIARHEAGGDSWEEENERSRSELEADISLEAEALAKLSNKRIIDIWGREIIKYFNRTEPDENPRFRVYVGSRLIDDAQGGPNHTWRKSNLVTIVDGAMSYDTMKCEVCGMTGRRYGLGATGVTPDRKFKKKVFNRCDTAKEYLKKGKK